MIIENNFLRKLKFYTQKKIIKNKLIRKIFKNIQQKTISYVHK